jgi:hypothetical protein
MFKKSIISSTCALALLATLGYSEALQEEIKSPELKAKEALQGGTLKDASHAINTEMLLNALENRSDELSRTVDRVLFIRALHNLNRLESEAGTLTEALATAKLLIKDDGLVRVFQHRAPEKNLDQWTDVSGNTNIYKSAIR